jgi:hypothetical protein
MNPFNDPQLLNLDQVVDFHWEVVVNFHCLVDFHLLVDFHHLVDFQWNLMMSTVLKRPLQQEPARIES